MHETPPPPLPDQSKAPEGKPERLYLVGSIGPHIGFHTTKDGKRVARFRLSVRDEDGSTQWHTVKAYGERAEILEAARRKGSMTEGTEVELVGYGHYRRHRGKGNPERVVAEIYVDTLTCRRER